MAEKSIIYLTDNSLEETLATKCRQKLSEVAQEIPIISVSQKPIDFGENVCVGEIGRSWLSLYRQLKAGAERVKTKYVSIAEHDCMYTREHLDWTPPKDDTFYYNENVWLVEWQGNHPELNGMYSTYWAERRALSQLVCNSELLLNTVSKRLELLELDPKMVRRMVFAGEPGVSLINLESAQYWAKSGKPVHLQQLLKEYLETEKSDLFRTEIGNLDIRHKSNFTGPKRGKNRTFNHPYWGEFKKIIT